MKNESHHIGEKRGFNIKKCIFLWDELKKKECIFLWDGWSIYNIHNLYGASSNKILYYEKFIVTI